MQKTTLSTKWLIVSLTFLLALAGCGIGNAPKGRKASADWSRGVSFGPAAVGGAGVAVKDGRVHLVWPIDPGQGLRFHYHQLDQTAAPVVSRELNLTIERVRDVRLASVGDSLLLFWNNRPDGSENWRLWYARFDAAGNLLGTAVPLSGEAMNVDAYSVAAGSDGAVVIWEETRSDALYGVRIDSGRGGEAVRLAAGQAPSARLDASGGLHLAWLDGMRILYDYWPADVALGEKDGAFIVDTEVFRADRLAGPALGLTDDTGYIVWSLFSQTGLQAGTGRAAFAAFPLDAPGQSRVQPLLISPEELPAYAAQQSAYAISQVAPPSSLTDSSDVIIDPDIANGRGPDLAVALSVNQAARQQIVLQPAVALLSEGEMVGYQFVGKTDAISQDVTLGADEAGDLHIVWREGAGGRRIYYATTAPAAQARLDRLAATDLLNILFAGLIEGVVGILFFPFALGWMLPGVILLGLWRLRRDDESIDDLSSRIVWLIAVALYEFTKVLLLPTILTYVPFSAWVDIAPAWERPMQIIVPVLTVGLGLVVAEWLRYRRERVSTFAYFMAFIGIDAALTLMIYGVGFLGVF